MTKPINIEEGLALLARATPGEWEACDLGDYGDFDGESRIVLGDDKRVAVFHHGGNMPNQLECDANIELAVWLHNNAPALLASQQQLAEAMEVLRPFATYMEQMDAYAILHRGKHLPDDKVLAYSVTEFGTSAALRMVDFRRARDFLTKHRR